MTEDTPSTAELIAELRAANQHGDDCVQCAKAHAVADAYDALAAVIERVKAIVHEALSEADDSGNGWDAEVSASALDEILSTAPATALAQRDARVQVAALREAALDVDGFERFLDEVGDAPLAMQRWLFDRIEREVQP